MAYRRAYQALENPAHTIFLDPIAPQLLTPEEMAQFADLLTLGAPHFAPEGAAACPDRASLLALAARVVPPSGLPLARARFIEDHLHEAMAQGTPQFVLIGAGLDTFAQRHPELLGKVSIFELDHPATQDDKRRRLARAGLAEPPGLHFVPVDLSQTPLDEALAATPHDPSRPSFFSWAGVTYYLPKDAVLATFSAMRRCGGPGSQVAFDYMEAAAFEPGASPEIERAQAMLRRIGEPFVTTFAPTSLGAELESLGWRIEEDLDRDAIEARYFRTMPGYRSTPHFRFAHARIKPGA
jgi:methyltransferase (TIGR00027 family)